MFYSISLLLLLWIYAVHIFILHERNQNYNCWYDLSILFLYHYPTCIFFKKRLKYSRLPTNRTWNVIMKIVFDSSLSFSIVFITLKFHQSLWNNLYWSQAIFILKYHEKERKPYSNNWMFLSYSHCNIYDGTFL